MIAPAYRQAGIEKSKIDILVKIVTPVKTGVQRIYNYLQELDSGFRRNDEKTRITTLYEKIKI